MLYRIYRTDKVRYDEYDSHIVIADNADDAFAHLRSDVFWDGELDGDYDIESIDIEGASGTLLSSYNAG